MPYHHFSVDERELIQRRLWEKKSLRSIAQELERSPSSISREVERNRPPLRKQYTPRLAQERALLKRKERGRSLRLKSQTIRRYVIAKLKGGFSPEQIAGRMPQEIGETLSHEAIYQYIYATLHRGVPQPGYPDLRAFLKRRHKKRIPKGTRKGHRVLKPSGISIDARPEIVATRSRIGDWEGDTVESRGHRPGINTLVDRKSGLVLITKLENKSGLATRAVVTKRLMPLPPRARRTLTLDNGPENRDWRAIEQETNIRVFFAHPYHSWERGTNENTNGLIRWYFPKGTDFGMIPDEEIAAVGTALNNRPRKRLGFRTPLEVFAEGVALGG